MDEFTGTAQTHYNINKCNTSLILPITVSSCRKLLKAAPAIKSCQLDINVFTNFT